LNEKSFEIYAQDKTDANIVPIVKTKVNQEFQYKCKYLAGIYFYDL